MSFDLTAQPAPPSERSTQTVPWNLGGGHTLQTVVDVVRVPPRILLTFFPTIGAACMLAVHTDQRETVAAGLRRVADALEEIHGEGKPLATGFAVPSHTAPAHSALRQVLAPVVWELAGPSMPADFPLRVVWGAVVDHPNRSFSLLFRQGEVGAGASRLTFDLLSLGGVIQGLRDMARAVERA